MNKMKWLGLLGLIAVMFYFWSWESKPVSKPFLPKSPKLPQSSPRPFSKPRSIVIESVSPSPSVLPEVEPGMAYFPSIEAIPDPQAVNLPDPEWVYEPEFSELSEEEKRLRKEQEKSDYEWLLKNKTLDEWYQEGKLSIGEYEVLKSIVGVEEMNSLEYFKGLLPKDWEWIRVNEEFRKKPGLIEEWKEAGFSWEEVKEWINIGLGAKEAKLAGWLKSQGKSAEWVLNFGNSEELRKAFKKINND